MNNIPYLGEMFALTTAVVWAVAVILFKRSGESVHPIALNLFKNVLSAALFVPTLWLVGSRIFEPLPARDYWILLLSGALGIGISDTFLFMGLNALGASLMAIVDCMYSPIITAFAMLLLGETLTVVQLLGVLMIVLTVVGVVSGRLIVDLPRKVLIRGTAYIMTALLMMGFGVIIAKPALERTPLVWATEWRLFGGILTLLVMMIFRRDRFKMLTTLVRSPHRRSMIIGSWMGAYLSMVLWLGGMKYTQASVASALNQTSNVFVFVLAAIFLREPLTRARIAGIILGVAGAYLVTFG